MANDSSGLTDDVLLVNATQLGCEQLLEQFRLNYPIEQWKTEGFFTEDDLLDINCHWLQFQPQKPYSHFSLAVLYVFLFTVGSVSNVTVIYILVRLVRFHYVMNEHVDIMNKVQLFGAKCC